MRSGCQISREHFANIFIQHREYYLRVNKLGKLNLSAFNIKQIKYTMKIKPGSL